MLYLPPKYPKMSKWIFTAICLLVIDGVFGQSTQSKNQSRVFVSLDQFTDFAIQNNPSIQQAILNEKVEQQNAAISPMLPTANIAAAINDNLILPSTVLPEALQPVFHTTAIQFGEKYNINPAGNVNLNLINAASYQNLYISKKNQLLAAANTQLTIEQIRTSLAQAYYVYLLYQSNFEFAKEDMLNADSLLGILQVRYDNQYIDELDLNRSKSTDLQSQNALDQNTALLQKALNNLKMLAGLSTTEPLTIEDKIVINDESLAAMITSGSPSRPEIQVSMLKVVINQMSIKREKLRFAPELSFFATYGVVGYNDNFRFADASQHWYQNGALGLSLNVPVFAGGIKFFSVQKAKLNQQIAELDLQNTRIRTEKEDQDIILDYARAKNDLKVRQKQLFLSDRDYMLALVKYRNEAISYDNVINVRNELLAAQEQLLQAQADYITAQIKIKIINSYDKK
jgi:outer membrane protein